MTRPDLVRLAVAGLVAIAGVVTLAAGIALACVPYLAALDTVSGVKVYGHWMGVYPTNTPILDSNLQIAISAAMVVCGAAAVVAAYRTARIRLTNFARKESDRA